MATILVVVIIKDNATNVLVGIVTATSNTNFVSPYDSSYSQYRYIGLRDYVLESRNHNYSLSSSYTISGFYNTIRYGYFSISRP